MLHIVYLCPRITRSYKTFQTVVLKGPKSEQSRARKYKNRILRVSPFARYDIHLHVHTDCNCTYILISRAVDPENWEFAASFTSHIHLHRQVVQAIAFCLCSLNYAVHRVRNQVCGHDKSEWNCVWHWTTRRSSHDYCTGNTTSVRSTCRLLVLLL